jgi:hypothetical protein
MIIYFFTSCSRVFHLHGYVTTTSEKGAKFRLMLDAQGIRAFEQEGHLSCHTCCGTDLGFFRSNPKDRPSSRLSRFARGCGEPILARILMDTSVMGNYWENSVENLSQSLRTDEQEIDIRFVQDWFPPNGVLKQNFKPLRWIVAEETLSKMCYGQQHTGKTVNSPFLRRGV